MHSPPNFWISHSKARKHEGPPGQVLVLGTDRILIIESLEVLHIQFFFWFQRDFSRVRLQYA